MPQARWPALALTCAVAAWSSAGALAELPPWVYGEWQRQAPVVMDLRVGGIKPLAGEMRVLCTVLKVIRQPAPGPLQSGQRVVLRYPLPSLRSPGVVGPSPLPMLRPGEEIRAWLAPVPGAAAAFAPAAGGRSFGPPMEDSFEPGAPSGSRR